MTAQGGGSIVIRGRNFRNSSLPATNAKRLRKGARARKQSIFSQVN
jgi:hypothetical protein